MSEYLNRDEGCYSQFGAVIGLMKYCNDVIFGWAVGADVSIRTMKMSKHD